ncbi:MAG: ROK family protein [Hyphomicrobiales bacterium]
MSTDGGHACLRLGIDLGGTKIAAEVLDGDGRTRHSHRQTSPRGNYEATIEAIAAGVARAEAECGGSVSVGLGIPGSISPSLGVVQNANSTWLNGKPLGRDIERRLGRQVRIANDANCFALSEAADGAGSGAASVFGVILGTGCGGGLVSGGRLVDGPRGIGGEWGHNPLPWPGPGELPGPQCWCGKRGCMETWVSGPGLAADHEGRTGQRLTATEIAAAASSGNEACRASLDRHVSRLARGLAAVVNILDPEVIVLGGGLSEMAHLYARLPELMAPWLFSLDRRADIRPPKHGAASGVRGAARLWEQR